MTTYAEEVCPFKDDCPDPDHNHTNSLREALADIEHQRNMINYHYEDMYQVQTGKKL